MLTRPRQATIRRRPEDTGDDFASGAMPLMLGALVAMQVATGGEWANNEGATEEPCRAACRIYSPSPPYS